MIERMIAERLGRPRTIRGLTQSFERESVILGLKVRAQWRDPRSPLGRFGGGWQYIAGVEVGDSTVIVNLVWFSIRIDKRKTENGK